ncbi:MAG: glyoxylase-like metal-dependent hydrolase (beta-lactamase superfamily II) [Planctomycetota bacterium]|jgi:glyoxylase-like metal-dependent hydrolase (beta-lactamase superfamily II)
MTSTSQKLQSVQLGEWTVTQVPDGFFRLDGGAMWGVVPKAMWGKLTPPAEDNTIRMALNCFLAERGTVKVLIEGGVGDRWSEKHVAMYHLDRTQSLRVSLAALDVLPEDITHAVASHCHWDHVGAWVEEVDGELKPLMPNAKHYAPEAEIAQCLNPDRIRKASYRSQDLQTLLDEDLLVGFTGETQILEGLTSHVLGGHSTGVSVFRLDGGTPESQAIFWSDIVPTTHHIQPAYIMAYDMNAEESYNVRSEWLERACEGGWVGLFYHDPEVPFARITKPERRYVIEPVQ